MTLYVNIWTKTTCVTAYISIAKPTFSLRAPAGRYMMWKWQRNVFLLSICCLQVVIPPVVHIFVFTAEVCDGADWPTYYCFTCCKLKFCLHPALGFILFLQHWRLMLLWIMSLRIRLPSAFSLVKCCSYIITYYRLLQNNTIMPRLSTTDMWNLHLPDFSWWVEEGAHG